MLIESQTEEMERENADIMEKMALLMQTKLISM
jgi:hypothetical protein